MKKPIRLLSILLVMIMLAPAFAKAQMPQMPPLPIDNDVRIGTLPNGLTYYIRHNEFPKGQADFYIAQKVGSILENDEQRGLAHFLEHMCFNGTTNFPGKNLINWLESVGVKFGQNLNAYTSVDQTVYNISNVPVDRVGVQDSCLLILHDWANDLLLLPEEIDAERGVIHQEWRRSMVGQMRILENLLPTIYQGSRYGYRLPIGTMEVVDHFPYQDLRDYYETWYRPDQQGIIVVGDIDVDRIEGKIKEMFSSIEMPENVVERVYFPVDDNQGTIYAIGHDKEQQNAIAELMIKTEAFPDSLKNTQLYLMQRYMIGITNAMLNNRLSEIASKPDAPFAGASAGYSNFFLAKTKDAFTIYAMPKSAEEIVPAMAAAYREVLRAARGGFNQSEFERARDEYLSRLEKQYNNRRQRENDQFVQEYVNNFLSNEPIPSIEDEYQLMTQLAQMLPLQAFNSVLPALVTPDNRVLLALLPDNEAGAYPTDTDFANALAAVDGETIEAYVDETRQDPLIPKLPKPGKIKATKELTQWGATEWTLSNGATVIVKTTDFKDDEIRMTALANHGTGFVNDKFANELIFMPIATSQYSLGTYTNNDLSKYLAGKQVSVSPSFGEEQTEISGVTTPKDLPTMMELVYMLFTNFGIDKDEYQALQNTYAGILANQMANPQYIFSTKLMESLFSNPRRQNLTPEIVNAASREEIVKIANAQTANAADFTFVFVGNIDKEALRPLVEQYIATLPGNAKKAKRDFAGENPALKMIGGKGTDTFTAPMQTPQTFVAIIDWATIPYSTRDRVIASITGQVLSKRLLDVVREREGAVYSIGAQASLGRLGDQNAVIQSSFPMKPELKDKVLGIIEGMFADLTQDVTDDEVAPIREFMVKNHKANQIKNEAWLGAIEGWLANGVDSFNGQDEVINSITPADVMDFASRMLQQGNYRVVVLDPEAAPAE